MSECKETYVRKSMFYPQSSHLYKDGKLYRLVCAEKNKDKQRTVWEKWIWHYVREENRSVEMDILSHILDEGCFADLQNSLIRLPSGYYCTPPKPKKPPVL